MQTFVDNFAEIHHIKEKQNFEMWLKADRGVVP
jgi:hypothetical protein